MSKEQSIPKSVRVLGVQHPVSVVKGKVTTEQTDPLAPIKTSPFTELLPASEEWGKKYGGGDISIVAFNVAEIIKEKASGKDTGKNEDAGEDIGKTD